MNAVILKSKHKSENSMHEINKETVDNKFLSNTLRTNKFNRISDSRSGNKIILPSIKTKSNFDNIQNLSPGRKTLFKSKIEIKDDKSKSPEQNTHSENFQKFQNALDNLKKINLNYTKKTLAKIQREKCYYYIVHPGNNSELIKKCLSTRSHWKEAQSSSCTTLYHLKWQQVSNGLDYNNISKLPSFPQIVNHLEFHPVISNKLNLFLNIMSYCEKNNLEVFDYIPFTVIIQYDSPSFAIQFENFINFFSNINSYLESSLYSNNYINKTYSSLFKLGIHNDKLGHKTKVFIPETHFQSTNMWLVKATDLNRGRCIKISNSIEQIKNIIKNFYDGIFREFKNDQENKNEIKKPSLSKSLKKIPHDFRKYRTSCMLVQKYIEKPLLYNGRKFDVRIWVLYTHKNAVYVFKEGHLKTSSFAFDVKLNDSYVHLTNYSVQKYCKEFSKHEFGNEVSFSDFQSFLNKEYNNTITIEEHIFPKIKNLIKLTFESVKDKINSNKRKFCFEIFGFDFIIDNNLIPFLLEVNTNPGLEESSPLIKNLLPRMIDDAFKLTIDDLFPSNSEGNHINFSPYEVEGYSSYENLWSLVIDFN